MKTLFLIFVIVFSVNDPLSGVTWNMLPVSVAVTSLPSGTVHFIITVCGFALVIITILSMIILRKVKQVKSLHLVTKELEESNSNYKRENRELEDQKVTMAKELADSERLYGMMISSADDAIAFYYPDWTIRFANPSFYHLIGSTEEEYNKMDPQSRDAVLLHPDDIGYSKKRIDAINDSGYFETELRVRHKDGTYRYLSSKSIMIKDNDGKALGILLISRDITSLKNAQQELVTAKDKAEESNRLKSIFLANISHEIRTPLNSIVGFANLLNEPDTTDEVKEEYIGYLNHNTDRLLQIISDIIDLSRLENAEIEIHYNPTRVNLILDEHVEYARSMISRSGKNIKLNLVKKIENGRDIIYTDEIWLKRVLRHLIDNSVKFTREGSITITSSVTGTSLMFTIKDTGIGISKEHLKSIFEQFQQEESGHHRPFEGLGVGLTLAKNVVEQMDGYLWVESEKGEGSEFFITLPYRPVVTGKVENRESDIEVEIPTHLQHNWAGRKVLIADDNNDILHYLNRIMTDTGVTVVLARSGEEALKIVKETDDLDLVLLDMQMTEMNGLEATREIRKIKADIPIIAQTAFIYEEDKDMILNAGCDACIIKPVRQDQLYSIVSPFLTKN